MSFKDVAKKIYYGLDTPSLKGRRLRLGFMFHTEGVHDENIYLRHLDFCRDFHNLTGARPICAVMSGVNALIREGIRKNISPREYVHRILELSTLSTIGYHGHYWVSPADYQRKEAEIRWNNFDRISVQEPLEASLQWFAENNISHNGLYCGGMWFTNEWLLRYLIRRGFNTDYTFSHSPWFRNQYCQSVMEEHTIACGVPMQFLERGQQLLAIQNLIGCHQTPFPEDFVRNLNKILDPHQTEIIGVVNTHDYDLEPQNTIRCIEYLMKNFDVKFFGHAQLRELASRRARIISFPERDIVTTIPPQELILGNK